MKVKEIINWRELSRHLSGSPLNVRKNKIPKKYFHQIKELEDLIGLLKL